MVDPVAPAEPAEPAIYGEPRRDPLDPIGAWLGVVVGDRHHVLLGSVESGVERGHLPGLVHEHLVHRQAVVRRCEHAGGGIVLRPAHHQDAIGPPPLLPQRAQAARELVRAPPGGH